MPMFTNAINKLTELNVTDISDNSKSVNSNTAFFCNEKAREKGFDLDAIKNGCKAILYTSPTSSKIEGILCITFASWNEYVLFLKEFFNTEKILKVGITGTNGKTSTAHFGAAMYSAVTGKAATIGTNGVCIYEKGKIVSTVEVGLTTPTCTQCHSTIASMQKDGIECVFMEVSSIGLHQGRVDGILFDVACFTNLTQDHLDYHSSMEDYFAQKLRLFTEFLKSNSTAILNSQSEYSKRIASAMVDMDENSIKTIASEYTDEIVSSITNGNEDEKNAISISYYGTEHFEETPEGFTLNCNGKEVNFPVHGRFQIQNLMCAINAVISLGVDLHSLFPIIPTLTAPLGRMQGCTFQGRNIIIDFAHTPDALANVLQSVTGYKITVFGCGGNRDKTKRPIMGEIASRLADFTIITNDNPRNEDPQTIADEIQSGFRGTHYKVVLDRTQAIKEAISLCPVGGNVIIAGKGSEPYQIIGDVKTPYSDFTVVQNFIAKRV